MQYVFKNLLSMEQIDMLKSLKDASLINVLVENAGDFVLNILINTPKRQLLIKNIPANESDGDEYPKFIIGENPISDLNYDVIYRKEIVKDISILREEASWENSEKEWIVTIDIGIKIIFNDGVLLIVAHDSFAGLIKLYTLKNEQIVTGFLEGYWSMKTDHLASLKREEIFI
ncbi:hypothetical protein [Paenibacillus sp. IHBB 3054]|uniref:hypothetical protein n=1 Tax=Paenibacillus sp. IHBB 3054 TaxID=3425689 RepID=UPI003F67C399